jgi:hypothetical protein
MQEGPTPPPLTQPSLNITNNIQFLDELYYLLDNIVFHWEQILFEEAFRPRIRAAWLELRGRFIELRNDFADQSANEDFQSNLRNVGLGETQPQQGQAQRDLKFRGLNTIWRRFFERPTIRKLKELLGWIDEILDSLAEVLPGLKAVKEFKETIERLIVSDETVSDET